MLIIKNFERKANVILYFATHTRHCTTTKLMHLLYLFDFEHFRQTGRSVTGEIYCALPEGPVPSELYWELHRPPGTSSPLEQLLSTKQSAEVMAYLVPKMVVCEDDLTRRQLRILAELSDAHCEDKGELLTAAVCAKDGPWDKTHRGGAGRYAFIPYELAVEDSPYRDQILELAQEHRQFVRYHVD